ncbi:MAG: oxygenase MpaB family protein [Thermoanaerobaculia bacterium]|nr:oxygenase MpaB family protein [Thermoanaerobaculia bacterium]
MRETAIPTTLVDREELERRLADLGAEVGDPAAGLFGPESALWRVNREAALFLGGGRAALLQVAHPAVAQAIAHHSASRHDPLGRFQRTFRQVFSMVWGSLDDAVTSSRRVHAIHTRITGRFDESVGRFRAGDTYHANEPAHLQWVHATLWETSVLLFETLFGPLEHDLRERYLRETRRFAALFGLEDDRQPTSWPAFEEYNRRMWTDGLAVGTAGRDIASYLFRAPDPVLQPAFDRLRDVTNRLLPDPVRAAFGWQLDEVAAVRADRTLTWVRRALPLLPARLRYVPPYFEALQRLGLGRASPLDGALRRAYVGG